MDKKSRLGFEEASLGEIAHPFTYHYLTHIEEQVHGLRVTCGLRREKMLARKDYRESEDSEDDARLLTEISSLPEKSLECQGAFAVNERRFTPEEAL